MKFEAVIADLTKCYTAPVSFFETLDRLEDEVLRREVPPVDLFFLARADQVREVRERFPEAQCLPVKGDQLEASAKALDTVKGLLETVVATKGFKRSLVITFNRQVLSECSDFQIPSLVIDTKPFSALPKRERTTQVESARPVPSSAEPEPEERGSYRMEDIIRQRELGPFSRVRGAVWDEVRKRFDAEAADKPFRQFVTDCVTSVLNDPVYSGQRQRLVTRSVRDALLKLLILSRVVTDSDGKPLTWGLQGSQKIATQLAPDFETRADAELVMVALDALGSLPYSDCIELAGALYLQRGVEAEDKVIRLLGFLLEEGRITEELDKNGETFFRVARILHKPTQPTPGPLTVSSSEDLN